MITVQRHAKPRSAAARIDESRLRQASVILFFQTKLCKGKGRRLCYTQTVTRRRFLIRETLTHRLASKCIAYAASPQINHKPQQQRGKRQDPKRIPLCWLTPPRLRAYPSGSPAAKKINAQQQGENACDGQGHKKPFARRQKHIRIKAIEKSCAQQQHDGAHDLLVGAAAQKLIPPIIVIEIGRQRLPRFDVTREYFRIVRLW